MKASATPVPNKRQWLRSALPAGVWLLHLLLSPNGFALDPSKHISQYNCQTWTRQNGLPANGIAAIAQTKDGYLWLGTSAGLVRFDGINFDLSDLKQASQIHSSRVRSLSASEQGGLWLGLNLSAFAYCDGKEVSFRGRDEWGGVSLNVLSILETRNRDLWLAAQQCACRLTRAGAFETILPRPGTNESFEVYGICEDSRGRVWLGTTLKGLFCWNQGVTTRVPNPEFEKLNIYSVVEDKQGRIWVGSQLGLLGCDPDFQKPPIQVSQTETRSLLVDSRGVLWAGLSGEGLLRYWNGTVTHLRKSDGLADDFVTALAEDREGSLWIGTRSGLSQISDIKLPTFDHTEGLPGDVKISVSASRKGGLWLATSSGFTCFDGYTNAQSYSTEVGLSNSYVILALEAKDGNIYLATGAQDVEVFSGGKIVARYPSKTWLTALAEDAEGVIVAGGGELYRVGTNSFVPFAYAEGGKLPLGYVYNMASGKEGSLWIATPNGLIQVKNGTARRWVVENGVPDTTLLWVGEDENGVVWAGMTSGIARLKNGHLRYISRKDGLFDNVIYAMVLDDAGDFWAHSDSGFFRVSRKTLNDFADGKTDRVECTAFNNLDAVKSADRNQQYPSGCKTLDGRIWFPTARGVVMVDPAHIPANEIPPPVHIDRVQGNGATMARKENISVPPGKGELEFHFTGLSFIAPQKVLFRYRLEGYDKEWVEAGNRRMAFYTNLKPGPYKFRVVAANADGIWNETGDAADIELRPHFHQTTWFYLFCGGLACSALAGVYAWRVRLLKRKHRTLREARDNLERRVEERTEELAGSLSLLNATIESTADGILVVDLQKRITSFNRRFTEMWRLPSDVMASRDADRALGEVCAQLKHPDAFSAEIHEMHSHPEATIHDLIEFKDGRVFERYSQPQRLGDRCVGRVWSFRDVTERNRAEADLAYERDLLRSLLDNASDRIYFKDANSRFVRCSKSKCFRSGTTQEEMIGKTDFDFFLEEHAKSAFEDEQEIIRTGKPVLGKIEREVHPDGSITWVLTSKMPWRDTAGKIIGTFGISKDITAIKKAEEELAYERHLLKALLESSPDQIYFKDAQSRFLKSSNAQIAQFRVKSVEEMLGKTDFDFFTEEHARPAFEDEQEIIRTGRPIIGKIEKEVWIDGRVTWAITNKMPLRNPLGEIVGTFGISKDITSLKNTEEALRRKTALFEALLNASLDGIMVVNDQGMPLVQNQQLSRLLKIPAETAALAEDAALLEFVVKSTKHPERFRAQVVRLHSHPGETSRDEVEFQDGMVTDTYSAAVLDEHGTYYGRIWAFRDITDQKRMQIEVEKVHNQLVDASRQAGQAEVASSVLHNVGNVLNSVNVSVSVIGDRVRRSRALEGASQIANLLAGHRQDMATFLAEDNRADKVTSFLKGIVQQMGSEQAGVLGEIRELGKNIEHINEIVSMQQNYARIAGVLEKHSIPALVEDALRLHANALARHHVRVVKEFDPMPDLLLDKHKVLQILVNLIANAQHALSESAATERVITLLVRMNNNSTVRISVADNGMGINPENLNRIFTHGFTTRKDGHGFGLHSGILAAKQMGGLLRAHSDGPGKGAVFTLEIPVRSQDNPHEQS